MLKLFKSKKPKAPKPPRRHPRIENAWITQYGMHHARAGMGAAEVAAELEAFHNPGADAHEAAELVGAWSTLRVERNRRLAETDWTQGRDQPEELSSKWAPYRQAVRDITKVPGAPYNIIWPTPPA